MGGDEVGEKCRNQIPRGGKGVGRSGGCGCIWFDLDFPVHWMVWTKVWCGCCVVVVDVGGGDGKRRGRATGVIVIVI